MHRDPIERLLFEHQGIMRQVADLRRAIGALTERGDAALSEVRPVLQATVRMIEAELLGHARREDDALFPALERALGAPDALTDEMRREHRDIHAQADLFRGTLRELAEVQHPAIVAEGARLRELSAGSPSAAQLRASGAEMIRLLDQHFRTEEEILFPMAREVLGTSELADVARVMETLDAR